MPTLADRAAIADRIDNVASLIAIHGWYRDGDFWPDAYRTPWQDGTPLEVIAAFYVERGITTGPEILAATTGPAEEWPNLDPAIEAFLVHLGIHGRTDDALSRFFAWEDTRRQVEIVADLRECAAALRGAGGDPMSVQPVKWQAWCDRCGEPAPELRDTEAEAERDADECESDKCLAARFGQAVTA